MIGKASLIIAITAALVSPASAAGYADRVREKTLANGLKVILMEDHKAPVTVFQVWYRVGSRDERPGKTGLSHLLEHMLFKGTERYGPEEYSRIVKRNGGDENAFTNRDNTTYFASVASDRADIIIELEADRMTGLIFDEKEFTPEQQVVFEERRLRTDSNPVTSLFEEMHATAFRAHPYQWPIIGWMSDIRLTTMEDAREHYKTFYAPDNAFIVAVGDFSSDELFAKIEKHFGALTHRSKAPQLVSIEPPQSGEKRVELRRPSQFPFVAVAYHVPNLRHDDAFALEVLAEVLAGGKSSRLYGRLVYEKRLAQNSSAGYEMTSADPGLFYLYARPLPGYSAEKLEKALLLEVEDLQQNPVSERELQKAKNGIEAGFVIAQDSYFYQAMLLGQYEIAGDWKAIDRYLEGVSKVTSQDIQRVAKFYLNRDNRTVATLVPAGSSSK